jgi:23S rRNA (guanosine2251-2'-O)-methyltransferase
MTNPFIRRGNATSRADLNGQEEIRGKQLADVVTTLCGFHAVEVALSKNQVRELYFDRRRVDRRIQALLDSAKESQLSLKPSDKAELDRLSDSVRHQGIVAIAKVEAPRTGIIRFLKGIERPLVLVLDGLQDPTNLGSCLRNGAAAGADAIVMPRHKGCGLTPAAARVAAGGANSLAIFEEGNWGPLLEAMKSRGLWLIGLDEHASDDIYQVDLSVDLALVVGAEDRGLRQLTRQRCDQLVRIPTHSPVKSLNAAMAAGIALFEAQRQRRGY